MEAIGIVLVGRRPALVAAVLAAALLWPAAAYSLLSEQSKLTGPGEIGAGRFGNNVALSSDGNTAIIGAYADDGTIGAAWVFIRFGSMWLEQAKLTAPASGADKEIGAGAFGSDVALSADGNTALIGGNADNSSLGAAWVYTRSGSTWSERKKLVVPSGASPPV